MHAILGTASAILQFCYVILVIWVVMSWLPLLGVVNRYNRTYAAIYDMLERLVEPALRPIRRIVPGINGIDLSPIILFFVILFLQLLINDDLMPLFSTVP